MAQVGGFGGTILLPGDDGYDEARRVWNGMIDRRPAMIARCAGAGDVSTMMRYVREHGLRATVRGGGHNVAGLAVADGAVLIDLSPMREVTVGAERRIAVADGGCLLRDLDEATAPHGLACPSGVVSDTGLGGLALGGGYGWLARRWGLTCDHIVGAEIVLTDGSIRDVDDGSDPDLMWALRGGTGNLGVVTRFRLALRPVADVLVRQSTYPAEQIVDAIELYREVAVSQPDDLHTVAALKPAGAEGRPELVVTAVWTGDPDDGRRATGGLAERLAPSRSVEQLRPFLELQRAGDKSEPAGRRYFTKSCYLTDVPATAAARLGEAARDSPSPLSSIDFEFLKGAIGRPPARSAFPHRDAPFICTASAHWTEPSEDAQNVAWARHTVEQLGAWHYGSPYANYVQDPVGATALYGRERGERLDRLKQRYDGTNTLDGTKALST